MNSKVSYTKPPYSVSFDCPVGEEDTPSVTHAPSCCEQLWCHTVHCASFVEVIQWPKRTQCPNTRSFLL